ncbi:transposase [Enterococcus mundtii]|uniref:transposase n=1 Tax=Enterococcus mundtii TaxID=53346 RepID=UPI002158E533|nr:transposase [Enterococcus mundtii]
MSIDMYLSDSLAQATSASHFCQKQVTDYQNLQQAITQFTLQTPNLQGKTYDAAKAYFSQILYPLVQGGILLSEAVEKAAKRFPQQYIEQVDSISLKQSELEAQIRQMNQYITQAEGIRQLLLSPHMPEEHQGFQLNQNTLLLTMYHDLKHKLEEKLQKLLAYNQSSAQFFTEIKSLEQAVNQGLAQTKTAWNSQTKTFSMPKDLSWTTTIQDKWQQADNEKKGIDPTKNKELEKYNVYALIIHDSEGNPRVFWKIEDKQSGYGIVNPELYQYVTKVGHYLEHELIQFMTYDTYQEKVNAAWRQGVNYETGEKLDPLLGSLVSTSQYVKDGYTWINESELGQALMVLGFTYASYKVLTTTGVKQVESGKIEDVSASNITNPDIENKLDYVFGKAKGNKHNIQRSQTMKNELSKIGILDTPTNRDFLSSHLKDVLKDSSNISKTESRSYVAKELYGKPTVNYTATVRESFLKGPNGGVKIESVWDGDRLLTIIIKGGR